MSEAADQTVVERARRPVPRPSEVEILTTLLLGPDEHVAPLPPSTGDFHAAFESVVIPALLRPPCAVSFSGGRDSSAVLALATDVARRHGLELPIPVTMRFPGAPLSDESTWQRLVLDHLGLTAEVVTLSDELEVLGEIATGVLRRHGLLWPSNAYMHRPVIDAAKGGSVLTGVGGDEVLDSSAPRRSARSAVVGSLPRALRARIWLARHPPGRRSWLTPAGQALTDQALAREQVSCPYRWDESTRWWYGSRVYSSATGVLDLIGADHDVRVIGPLIAPRVLSELIALGGRTGFPTRAEAMRRLVGHLLPEALVRRPTKATFGAALWGPATREWLASWDGNGLPDQYVDRAALRAELDSPDPDGRTVLLLHHAWLSVSNS